MRIGWQNRGCRQKNGIKTRRPVGPDPAQSVQPAPARDILDRRKRCPRPEPFQDTREHLFRCLFNGIAPGGISLGGEKEGGKAHRFGHLRGGDPFDARTGAGQAGHGIVKPLGRPVAHIVQRHGFKDGKARARKAGPGQINGFAALKGCKQVGAIFNRVHQRADGIKRGAQRDSAGQGQASRGGFQADKIIPRRRYAHGPARVRPDGRRGQPEGNRRSRARGRPPRHGAVIVQAGRRCGHRVQPKAGKGEFRHMRLAKAHEALKRGGFKHSRIAGGGAVFQKGRPGLGRHPRRIKEVFPAYRHTVQKPLP